MFRFAKAFFNDPKNKDVLTPPQQSVYAMLLRECEEVGDTKNNDWLKERVQDAILCAKWMMEPPQRVPSEMKKFLDETLPSFHLPNWRLSADPHLRARQRERLIARDAVEKFLDDMDPSGELLARPKNKAGWQKLVAKWIKDHSNKT
jgi:hypothetical protein